MGTAVRRMAIAVPATSAVHSVHAFTRHQNQRSRSTTPVPFPKSTMNRNTRPTSCMAKLAAAARRVMTTVATRPTATSRACGASGAQNRW